ncbi:MAG: hypothetical protein JSS66_00870 [Armatimonadetes bacterium]|nr:hypothetical protein [Armatimonadota bacterium]
MTVALLCAALLSRPVWQVNTNNTLLWEGKPYMPVGIEVNGDAGAIDAALKTGVRDFLVDLPADGTGWSESFAALEAAGARYMVELSNMPPTREAVMVDPAGYRIPDVTRKTTIDVPMPEASEALVVLAVVRDGSVRWSKRVPVVDGRLHLDVDPLVEVPHVLLVYPVVRTLEAPDFFEGLDSYRDRLLGSVTAHKPGAGFRGFVGPLGRGIQFPGADTDYVPCSRLFQAELAAYLEQKYASVSTSLKAWALSANDITEFGHLARLVPLWSETRGVESLWDSETDHLYGVDRKTSLAWRDIRTVLRNVAQKRVQNFVSNLQAQSSAPVLFTWTGWNGPYSQTDVPIDGVAFSTGAGLSVAELIDRAARPVSAIIRRKKPGMVIAKNLSTKGGASSEDAVAELEGMGVRGFFFSDYDATSAAKIAQMASARASDTSASEWTVHPLFYPEAARDPAVPMRLAGGLWWLPSPTPGTRLILGAGFEGYRLEDASGTVHALWATEQPVKTTIRVDDPKAVSITTADGQPVDFKIKKKDIELEVPTSPILIRGSEQVPVPMPSMADVTASLTILFDQFENQVNPNGNEQYIFAEAVKGFDRTPGSSFMTLRTQLNRMLPKAAPYVWIAASRSTKHNFGEAGPVSGSSSDNVLMTSTRFAPSGGRLSAEYPLTPRKSGVYGIWVAAQIPDELRSQVRVFAGDRMLGPPEKPTSFYGDGFAWYKFGEIELPRSLTSFRFECPAGAHANVALDVVLLAPTGFRPEGPRIPSAWLKEVQPVKVPKPGKG